MKKIVWFPIIFILLSLISRAQEPTLPPRTGKPVYFDISPPLRDMVYMEPEMYDASWKDGVVFNYIDPSIRQLQDSRGSADGPGRVQVSQGDLLSDTTIQNFEGLPNVSGYIPPDTHGEAGVNYFFQTVNCSYAIYNKTGAKILGPLANSSVWSGMPNNANSGDAVVLYDEQADRWLFSQFSLPNGSSTAPYYQMIAISQTSDPTGSWYRYQYEFPSMPDYPKFGIWPDGYYMATNNFGPSPAGWTGNGAYAFDRDAMLTGDPEAQMIAFTLPPSSEGFISPLPSDCDGEFPAMGTPNYFIYIRTNNVKRLGIYEFHADWNNPPASTFGNVTYLNVTPFNTSGAAGNGIPQLGSDKVLETLADRLMYRLQYRKFNDYGSLVLNHTVNAGTGHAGVRWYELRDNGSGWGIYQESTYAPSDGLSRWMGSIAQDTAGTIALGYSVSGSTIHPGIRYTGRLKSDPLNQMTMAEKAIMHGGGSQTGIWSGRSRWGDYSGMSVDPASPTTFWYTTEYYASNSSSNWQTRIASFTFDNVFSSAASATPTLMCSTNTDSVQLEAYAYGGSGQFSFSWGSIPAGFFSSLSNPKVKPDQTTRYYVAVSDGSLTRTDTVEVRISMAPVANAGNDTLVCWYLPAIPMNGSASNYSKVAWGTTGDGSFTHPYEIITDYKPGLQDIIKGEVDLKLMVIPLTPCMGFTSDTKRLLLDPCTGMNENSFHDTGMEVYPNPADREVSVTLRGITGKPTLSLSDLSGRIRIQKELSTATDKQPMWKIDISALPEGLYLLSLQHDKGILLSKLVVTH